MNSYWDENYWWIIFILVVIIILIAVTIAVIFSSPVIKVSLVNANSDLSGGPQAFEFKVKGKEMAPFTQVRVIGKSLEIEVIEFSSQRVVDKVDIESLIKDGDVIGSEHFAKTSSQEEELNIYIEHLDGKVNKVSVNIK